MSVASTLTAAPAVSASPIDDLAATLARLPEAIRAIPDIVREPGSNPTQATLLIAIAGILVLLVIVSMFLIVLRAPKGARKRAGDGVVTPRRASTFRAYRPSWWTPAHARLLGASLALCAVVVILMAAGIGSSRRDACLPCHSSTAHTSTREDDPHADVDCVACHESGGPAARITVNVFRRAAHFLDGYARRDASTYGRPIASDACAHCHRERLSAVYTDVRRGLRVEHARSLEAGAECTDCHPLRSGRIAQLIGNMDACRRCHELGKASGACETCHMGDPALVRRALESTGAISPAKLVRTPNCGSCHKNQKSCDACHGVRLPHTQAFMASDHAYEATLDIWRGKGACKKCHYEGHNPCSRCHSPFPGHPVSFRVSHRAGDPNSGCSCHPWNAQAQGRTFCQLCHPDSQ